ncbi:MAG: HTTM domain-containing protein [Fuerstiella sp.]|nr:HTTM domain-containing protein [Fuerstiella sp.]
MPPVNDPEKKRLVPTSLAFSRQFFVPVDISFLAFFRIVYGLTMLWYASSLIISDEGWIKRLYIDPVFHFTWYGFEWIRPWPGAGMYIHFVVMLALSICVTFGFYYRIAAPLLCGCFSYVFLLEQTIYQNHNYLIVLIGLLMAMLPAHRTLAIDVVRVPAIRSSVIPAWMLWILRIQIGIPYFFGGVAKLNGDWLQGIPMRVLLADKGEYPLIGPYVGQDWMVFFFAWGSLAFDLLIVPLVLWPRTQKPAFILAVVFHLANAALFRISVFPWLMIGATTVFFRPEWARHLWRQRRRTPVGATDNNDADRPLSLKKKLIVVGLGAYVGVQLLAPFRHFLYPGNVDWTEEGARFSWRMMLREKKVRLDFSATHTETGQTVNIDLRPYLAGYQAPRLQDPDMILQFSKFLARQLKLSSADQVEIRASMLVSLNGRKPQTLIDPKINLASERRSLWHKPWILPLKEPVREEPWTVPVHQWDVSLSHHSNTETTDSQE